MRLVLLKYRGAETIFGGRGGASGCLLLSDVVCIYELFVIEWLLLVNGFTADICIVCCRSLLLGFSALFKILEG